MLLVFANLIKNKRNLCFGLFFTPALTIFMSLATTVSRASVIEPHIRDRTELEYGVLLYEFFQKDYFSALVEHEYALELQNPIASGDQGQVMKGGLMLSYGMAEESEKQFRHLLNENIAEDVRNRVWYFMGKFYYNKSAFKESAAALQNVKGKIPQDLHFDYHYLATLVKDSGSHQDNESTGLDALADNDRYPYLLFNLAIGQLRHGKINAAIVNLDKVAAYQGSKEEHLVLADRARHGLAELYIRSGQIEKAWYYLQGIRSTGVYSNRALLAYAWAAINQGQFTNAIAALQLLNSRSIASPEVQEAKVLLAHLYEQEGSPRKALKANLLAIKDFKTGVDMVTEARRIIDQQDVPREFITNLDAIMDDSDWNSAQPSVDYKNLTPFLIDLMASNPFHETLKELANLYSLRDNLTYWLEQSDQHLLIMENAEKMAFDEGSDSLIERSKDLNARFADKKAELNLLNMTLDVEDQDRVEVLLETTSNDLLNLDEKVVFLENLDSPYKQPQEYKPMLLALRARIEALLERNQSSVVKLEPIMRQLVKLELDKHEERMSYYSAQSRLAKARLYDTELSNLREVQHHMQDKKAEDNSEGSKK